MQVCTEDAVGAREPPRCVESPFLPPPRHSRRPVWPCAMLDARRAAAGSCSRSVDIGGGDALEDRRRSSRVPVFEGGRWPSELRSPLPAVPAKPRACRAIVEGEGGQDAGSCHRRCSAAGRQNRRRRGSQDAIRRIASAAGGRWRRPATRRGNRRDQNATCTEVPNCLSYCCDLLNWMSLF